MTATLMDPDIFVLKDHVGGVGTMGVGLQALC